MNSSSRRICAALLLAATAIGWPPAAHAGPPMWWLQDDTRVIVLDGTPNHFAPANLGQLKYVARRAKAHLDATLPGGAGTGVNAIVATFAAPPGGFTAAQIAENHAPVNLGQLKYVAKPFYDRLLLAGYDTRASLIAHGLPGTWAHDYPWNPATDPTENFAPANLGQLKIVFSFNATPADPNDTDGDGLPDAWETTNGLDPTTADSDGDGRPDGVEDPDGDEVSSQVEYAQGRNPQIGAIEDTAGDLSLEVFTPLR